MIGFAQVNLVPLIANVLMNLKFKRKIQISNVKILTGVAQVNLIPLIAKADSFTKEELQEFKQNVSLLIIFENQNGKFSLFFCRNLQPPSCFLSLQICNQLTSEKISFHNFSTCRHQVEKQFKN